MTPAELQVAHHFVDLPGLRMHYVERGEGPVVVLLHGFPESWWSWRYQIAPLADAGYRVIVPDLRGYGETERQGPYDLDTIVGDVTALIESLGAERRVKVVGHDWGGATAWHLAAHRPEFCERVAVLNCPHPAILREKLVTRPSLRQLRRSWYIFFFQIPALPEFLLTRNDAGEVVRMLRGVSVDRSHFSADELRPFRDGIQQPGAATAMVGWYRDAVRRGFRAPRYPTITCPTLLLWGADDRALSYDDLVPGTERHAPRVVIEQILHAGHYVHAERPEQVNPKLLAFLGEHA